MRALQKIAKARRSSSINRKKVDAFKKKLDATMKLWPRGVMYGIENEEDRLFLRSMMEDRVATFGTRDNVNRGEPRKQKGD